MELLQACLRPDETKVKEIIENERYKGKEININYQENYGWSSLHIACLQNSPNIVSILLSHPWIDVNICNNEGQTPLLHASATGHPKLVSILVEDPRVDLNLADKTGWTPIMAAAFVESLQCVKILMASGRPLNLTSFALEDNRSQTVLKGDNALDIAARKGREDIVRLILDYLNNPKLTIEKLRLELNCKNQSKSRKFLFSCADQNMENVKTYVKRRRVY